MLEAHLNTRLINRSTRSLSLTEAGARYLDGCRAIVANVDDMDANLTRTAHSPHGTVRIAASTTFANTELVALLADYRAAEPGVDFEVATFEANLDLIEGGAQHRGHRRGYTPGRPRESGPGTVHSRSTSGERRTREGCP